MATPNTQFSGIGLAFVPGLGTFTVQKTIVAGATLTVLGKMNGRKVSFSIAVISFVGGADGDTYELDYDGPLGAQNVKFESPVATPLAFVTNFGKDWKLTNTSLNDIIVDITGQVQSSPGT
jgi:hypothetical protein